MRNKKGFAVLLFLIFAVLVVWLLSGCKTPVQTSSVKINDSTYVEKLVHDTTRIPADSSWFYAWLKCDSLGNVIIASLYDHKTEGIKTDVTFNNGKLIYTTEKASKEIVTTAINKETKVKKQDKETITITLIKMSLFQKIFFWIGLIGSVAGLIYLGIKIKGRILI